MPIAYLLWYHAIMSDILAVDVGTQSLKTGIVDHDLKVKTRRQIFYNPEITSGTQAEIDPELLWQAFIDACSGLNLDRKIEAITFSTLCPSLVTMSRDGKSMRPMILHLDRRSHSQALWALKRVGEERFLKIAGNLPIPGGISLTSLLWIKENEPALYNRRDVIFGHAVTFFLRRLTGKFFIDPSNASFTGLFETVKYGNWSSELLRELKLSRTKLPEIILSSTVVGKITREISNATGLPAGTPVVIGANDTTCAAVGAAIKKNGDLMNTTGTVESMVLCTDHPLIDRAHLLRTHAYSNRWLAMKVVGAGGGSIEWFRRTLCKELSREVFYNEYFPEVLKETTPPDARFQPYLSGDRHSIRQKTGAFTGLSLSTSREELLLSLARGIAASQIAALKKWRQELSLPDSIFHVGGGASQPYSEFKERLYKDYKFINKGETTLKGAALLAFTALKKG